MTNANDPINPFTHSWIDPKYAEERNDQYSGLSIREYFAGLAMQGICADRHHRDSQGNAVSMAYLAVQCADALIDRLNKTIE